MIFDDEGESFRQKICIENEIICSVIFRSYREKIEAKCFKIWLFLNHYNNTIIVAKYSIYLIKKKCEQFLTRKQSTFIYTCFIILVRFP